MDAILRKFYKLLERQSFKKVPDRFWRYVPEHLDTPFQEKAFEKCYVTKAKTELLAAFAFYSYMIDSEGESVEESLSQIIRDLEVDAPSLGRYIVDTNQVLEGTVEGSQLECDEVENLLSKATLPQPDLQQNFCYTQKVRRPVSGDRKSSRLDEKGTWIQKTFSIPIDLML